MANGKKLDAKRRDELFAILEERFKRYPKRHAGVEWAAIRKRLEGKEEKLWSLSEMERTGGEPDLTAFDAASGIMVFCDCSPETPEGRRSLCYDRAALDARKANKPENSALDLASAMGVEMLSEAEYQALQTLGEFDLKTSSWVATPEDVRERGGALFCDRRFGRVFTYHNGADSYYGARGFRSSLRV